MHHALCELRIWPSSPFGALFSVRLSQQTDIVLSRWRVRFCRAESLVKKGVVLSMAKRA